MKDLLAMTISDGVRETTLLYEERDLTSIKTMFVAEGEQFIIAAGVYDNFTVAGGQDCGMWTERPANTFLEATRSLQQAARAKPTPESPRLLFVLWQAIELLEESSAPHVFVRHHFADRDGNLKPDPSQVMSIGASQLFRAIRRGDLERIRKLAREGVDLNAVNSEGASALSVAASIGGEALKLMLELGSDPNRKFTFTPRALKRLKYVAVDVTPLMYARSAEAAQLLVACHAEINAQDQRGNTALMRAAERGEAEVIRALLELGADASIRQHRLRGRKARNALELVQEAMEKMKISPDSEPGSVGVFAQMYIDCLTVLSRAAA